MTDAIVDPVFVCSIRTRCFLLFLLVDPKLRSDICLVTVGNNFEMADKDEPAAWVQVQKKVTQS